MQDANFRLSIRVDDKFCKNRNIESFIKSICAAPENQTSSLGARGPEHGGVVDAAAPFLPFLVGASWTDSVISFWLAGRMGLSDSACFLFMSLLNCLLSAHVRNFFTVTCSKSKHFSRYERKSSSSARSSC